MLTLTINTSEPSLAGLCLAEFIKNSININVKWKNENSLKISTDILINSNISICRYLALCVPEMLFYGGTYLEEVEIDHWISFGIGPLTSNEKFKESIEYLEYALNSLTFLVGHQLTIADLLVWNILFCNYNWNKLSHCDEYKNIKRWFSYIENLKEVKFVLSSLPEDFFLKPKGSKILENKDEGKFVELPNAKKGEVVVRFPPEASGYLHIGHAKAALLNQYYQELFEGKLIMRFDDTNPEKEKIDFEKVILEDLKLLQIYPDQFTHTSDYFDVLLKMCEKLLNENQAYVDDTDPETMKKEREQKIKSKNRENSIQKNLNMWSEMLKGTSYGQKCCVRVKIDMNSDNGCMRDPTIYRCKNEPHPRTGSKYQVYPTYDFACPIVDSIEGVTHALRTMEYHDRDDQFNWFIEALNLRKVHIWEYSRLNMMNTVLSKRKLTWFVNEKIVDSWEDPRLPTVRGVVRRGLTIEGLKQFIIAQGSSRTVVQMEWDKIWAFNKKIIDPIAPRYTALKKDFTILVNVKGSKKEKLIVPKHPKNPSLGTKEIWTGSNLLIEASDAELLKEGDNATFINWGNLKIKKINRDCKGLISSVDAETNLSDTNFKKTLKLTWLANMEVLTPVEIYYYDHIITKPILGKEEDFKKYVNYNSKSVINYIAEENLRNLNVGDIIQLQRIGFFRCDVPYKSEGKVVLIHIPDGSNKSKLLTCSESNNPTFKSSSDFKENEKLFLKNKFMEHKSLPVSNQELEQIAFQWRNDRENLKTQSIEDKKKFQ